MVCSQILHVCAPHQRILACENLTEEREDNMKRENFLFLFFPRSKNSAVSWNWDLVKIKKRKFIFLNKDQARRDRDSNWKVIKLFDFLKTLPSWKKSSLIIHQDKSTKTFSFISINVDQILSYQSIYTLLNNKLFREAKKSKNFIMLKTYLKQY